jgi:hypothetical protein
LCDSNIDEKACKQHYLEGIYAFNGFQEVRDVAGHGSYLVEAQKYLNGHPCSSIVKNQQVDY